MGILQIGSNEENTTGNWEKKLIIKFQFNTWIQFFSLTHMDNLIHNYQESLE